MIIKEIDLRHVMAVTSDALDGDVPVVDALYEILHILDKVYKWNNELEKKRDKARARK